MNIFLLCRYEDFAKNSVPGKMLELVMEKRFTNTAPLKIYIECTVEKILHDGKKATTLKTNKGDLALGNAKLIFTTSFFVHENYEICMKCYKDSYICTYENDSMQILWMDFFHEFVMKLVWKDVQCMKC